MYQFEWYILDIFINFHYHNHYRICSVKLKTEHYLVSILIRISGLIRSSAKNSTPQNLPLKSLISNPNKRMILKSGDSKSVLHNLGEDPIFHDMFLLIKKYLLKNVDSDSNMKISAFLCVRLLCVTDSFEADEFFRFRFIDLQFEWNVRVSVSWSHIQFIEIGSRVNGFYGFYHLFRYIQCDVV